MADATTTILALTKPEVTASDNTWGGKLNTNWDNADLLIAGITTISTTSGTDVLSTAEQLVRSIICDGTLVGNLTLQFDRKGVWYVQNATSGSYTLSVEFSGQSTPPTIVQGSSAIVLCDGAALCDVVASFDINGDIAFGTNKITGLGDATADTDALNRQAADARYLRMGTTSAKTFSDTPFTDSDAEGNRVTWDATGGACTHDLPAAATAGDGFRRTIVKIDASANDVTIDGNTTETINGATTFTLDHQWQGVVLRCDGSNWTIEAEIDDEVTTAEILDGTIVEADLADNAVTLAKMVHGTQGGILYYGASGAPTELAVGAAGQVLKSQGAAADPEWGNASWGTAIDSGTIQAGTEVEVTGIGGYSEIKVRWDAVSHDSGSNRTLQLVVGTGGTPTYVTSGYLAGVIEGGGDSNSTTAIPLIRTNQSSLDTIAGWLIFSDWDVAGQCDFHGRGSDTDGSDPCVIAGSENGTTARTAIKFQLSGSGNFDGSGTFEVFGR